MNTYGYARVSSWEQNEDRQLIGLKEVGLTGEMFFWTNNLARILTDHNTRNC